MNKINWVITKWCKLITDDNKDWYVNKDVDKKHMIHRFRIMDADEEIYAYGVSDSITFNPVDYYMNTYGVVDIQYKNKETGEYETL